MYYKKSRRFCQGTDYPINAEPNDTNSYYKPFYEADTLYTVIDQQHCPEVTPAEGSYYRTFVMTGRALVQ